MIDFDLTIYKQKNKKDNYYQINNLFQLIISKLLFKLCFFSNNNYISLLFLQIFIIIIFQLIL